MIAPRRIHALGLTYRDHLRETGERPDRAGPAVFGRDVRSVCASDEIVEPSRSSICAELDRLEPGVGAELSRRHPRFPALLDYEIELAMIVADEEPRVRYCLANDVTVRTVQILGEGARDRMAFWSASKSFPSTLVLGDTVHTTDDGEIPRIELVLRVNGETRQRSSTAELLYDRRRILALTGAEGGDLVLTGTPGGIALRVPRYQRVIGGLLLSRFGRLGFALRSGSRNPRFLRPGDVVEMEAGPLGCSRATVVAALQ